MILHIVILFTGWRDWDHHTDTVINYSPVLAKNHCSRESILVSLGTENAPQHLGRANQSLGKLTRHQIHPVTWRSFTFLPNFNLIRITAKPSSLKPTTSNSTFPQWRGDLIPLRILHEEPNQFRVWDKWLSGSSTLNLIFSSSGFSTKWNYCTFFLSS